MSMSSIQLNFILAVSHLQSYNHTAFYLAVKELRNKYLAHQEPRNELDLCLTINPEIIFFKNLKLQPGSVTVIICLLKLD